MKKYIKITPEIIKLLKNYKNSNRNKDITENELHLETLSIMKNIFPKNKWKAFFVKYHKNMKPFACADKNGKYISFSKMINYTNKVERQKTIIHELIHLLLGIHNHGNEFKYWIEILNGSHYACTNIYGYDKCKREYRKNKQVDDAIR